MKLNLLLIPCGWTILISSIILQALYISPMLMWFHWLLLLLASILSGILLVDLKRIVLSYFVVVALSLFVIIFCLALLPVIAGKVLLETVVDTLLGSAMVMVVRSTFPGVWIMCLLGGILGGGIGERLRVTAAV